MRVSRVRLTFAANVQRLTTRGSLIYKTHRLTEERPTLQNTSQLSSLPPDKSEVPLRFMDRIPMSKGRVEVINFSK